MQVLDTFQAAEMIHERVDVEDQRHNAALLSHLLTLYHTIRLLPSLDTI